MALPSKDSFRHDQLQSRVSNAVWRVFSPVICYRD